MELSTRLCCPSAKGMSSMSWSVSSPEKIWTPSTRRAVFRPDLADGEGDHVLGGTGALPAGGRRDGEGLDPALTVGDLDRQQVIFPGRADLGHHNSGVLDGELRPGGIDSDLQSPKLFLHMEPPSGVMVRRLLDHPMPGPRSGFPCGKKMPAGAKTLPVGHLFSTETASAVGFPFFLHRHTI